MKVNLNTINSKGNDNLLKDLIQTQPFRAYSPEHPNHPSKIFGGVASGIRSWDDLKYPLFLDYQKSLFGEFWIPEEVLMSKDKEQYGYLTKPEQIAYQYNSGMLNWLDSLASDVVTMLFLTTSDPSLRTVLTLIASFETMHNVSYEYITSSVLNDAEKRKAFGEVREIPELVKRNNHIIVKLDAMITTLTDYLITKRDTGQEEMSQETLQTLFEGLVAYQTLEAQYFAGGFIYFHSLARDNKMLESNNVISLIRADENFHSEIFGVMIQILMEENPSLNTQENLDYSIEFVKTAVELEKEWANFLYEGVDTLSIAEYHDYAEHLANLVCRNAGMREPYPDNADLKSQWIITYGSKGNKGNEIASKADFLQSNSINYGHEVGGDFDL